MGTLAEPLDLAITFRDVELIERIEDPEHRLEIWRHPKLGQILSIDGEVQHVEAWQALYHEPLVHVPAAFVPRVETVLILGGGSLFAASQALQYPTLVSCILVDHNPKVLALVERNYAHARRVRNDIRFKFVERDIAAFLTDDVRTFDLVVNDGIDTVPGQDGKDVGVHALMQRHLNPGGVCADVIYRHVFEIEHGRFVRSVLESLGTYALAPIVVPEYPGTLHLLTMWGNSGLSQDLVEPINVVQREWCVSKNAHLAFYDPRYLKFSLFLPPYLRCVWDTYPMNVRRNPNSCDGEVSSS